MIAFFRWERLGTPGVLISLFFLPKAPVSRSLRTPERLFYIDALDNLEMLGTLGTRSPAAYAFLGTLLGLCPARIIQHPVKLHRHLFSLIVHGVTVAIQHHSSVLMTAVGLNSLDIAGDQEL